MAFPAAFRHGRSPEDGYRRGWGLEFGTLREAIRGNADFQHAFSYATDRTLVTVDRLMNLFLLITEYLPNLSFGHIIEYGSYRAGSAFFMGVLASRFLPGCQVYAFDTFAGLLPGEEPCQFHD
jgi:Macrocin-O-methyltransferase (TylF)